MVDSAKELFDVDFLTYCPSRDVARVCETLTRLGCRPLVLDSLRPQFIFSRLAGWACSALYSIKTGLKRSNYWIGKVELSASRVRMVAGQGRYDVVVFEYFHAFECASMFSAEGAITVLDTHNLLYKSLERSLERMPSLPARLRRWVVQRYRVQEERAWRHFDYLIAINRREQRKIEEFAGDDKSCLFTPMGIDLALWPYSYRRHTTLRIAYYGGLASQENELSALLCHDVIMPMIWAVFPEAELWLVGSGPSERVKALQEDGRVKVTGFVERVGDVLSSMSLVLCPWKGSFGFRSRVIEVMALGIPLIASSEAVEGMELVDGRGLLLRDSPPEMASTAITLLQNPEKLTELSLSARGEIERLYSLDKTYGKLMEHLSRLVTLRTADPSAAIAETKSDPDKHWKSGT